MAAPMIGITAGRRDNPDGPKLISVNESYVKAVIRAGGIPLIIPVGLPKEAYDNVFALVQGLLFTGGPDIDPVLFNGEANPNVYGIDPDRDDQELYLMRSCAEEGVPFLGVCRGMQVMNVALGGGLYTDIGDQFPGAIRHDWYPGFPRTHTPHAVELEAGSALQHILGDKKVDVNSLHHQGVSEAAPGLRICGRATDGLIEAIEMPGHPFGVGVQWHPEELPHKQPMADLFIAFVTAAASR